MPRFAALVVDVAVGYTVFVVTSSAWLSDDVTHRLILGFPVLMVPWEALWLRLTGATVGHWLTSIGLVWPRGRPGYLRLCWRTVKRYALFWLIIDQPSNVAPGVLAVETVRPVAFGRVSRMIDGDGIVASRGWSVTATSAVFALCLAIPTAGIVTALTLDPPPLCEHMSGQQVPREQAEAAEERSPATAISPYTCRDHHLRAPLLAASITWMVGAGLSTISIVDARGAARSRRAE